MGKRPETNRRIEAQGEPVDKEFALIEFGTASELTRPLGIYGPPDSLLVPELI